MRDKVHMWTRLVQGRAGTCGVGAARARRPRMVPALAITGCVGFLACLGFALLADLARMPSSGTCAAAMPETFETVVVAAAPPATIWPPFPANADEVLRRVVEAPLVTDFEATQVAVTWGPSGSSACLSRVLHRHPDQTRIEFAPSVQAPARIVIYSGSELYHYELGSPVVLVMSLSGLAGMESGAGAGAGPDAGAGSGGRAYLQDGSLLLRDLELVKKNFNVTLEGAGLAAGRRCWVVGVSPRRDRPAGSSLRLWVDSATWLILRVEKRRPDGSLELMSYLTDLTTRPTFPPDAFAVPSTEPRRGGRSPEAPGAWGPAGGPGSRRPLRLLRVEPPVVLPSLESAMQVVGHGLVSPAYLPDGYVFEAVQLRTRVDRPLVQALYTDGLNTVSLFQTLGGTRPGRDEPLLVGMAGARRVRLSSGEAWVKCFGTTVVAARMIPPLTVTVVGDLDEDTVIRIASSLRPLTEAAPAAPAPPAAPPGEAAQRPGYEEAQPQDATWRALVFRFIYRIFSVD